MKTELIIDTDENPDLDAAEAMLWEAEQEVREGFYHVGNALLAIKNDEPFKPKGGRKANGRTTFKSWDAWCSSPRCPYSKQHCDRAIRAAQQRASLPDLSGLKKSGTAFVPLFWTMETAEQMARLDSAKGVREALSKIKKAIASGERFGTKMVKRIVDDMLGVTRKSAESAAKKLQEAPDLTDTLNDITDSVHVWVDSLAQIPGEEWERLDNGSSGPVRLLTQALSEFIAFLKE